MDGSLAKLAKYRQIMGIAVAGIILAGIFVPIQFAEAFTVTIDLPDDDDDIITQSSSGEPFEITITIEAGEVVSISNIQIILDNEEASLKSTTFDSDGEYVEGSASLVIGNVVEIDTTPADTGYGYGYGFVSGDPTFNGLYSYSFTSNVEDFIGGNSGGSGNPGVTDFVTGFGPGTVTISGTLRTSDLADGDHTLDVLIDTGAGGNNEDILVATQFDFTVEEAEDLENVEEEVTAGATSATVTATTFEVNGTPATITLNFGAATTTTGNAVVTLQTPADFIASKTAAQLTALGLEADGDDLVIDGDFTVAGVINDIDLSALGLPPGTEITIGVPYDDSGLTDDEEEDMRLFHFNDDTDTWETLTNDDVTVNGGDEVDTTDNIVYGTTDDLSLFAPAFEPEAGGGPGGPGGGGVGGTKVIVNQTFPPSYFLTHPLSKVQISQSGFTNMDGNTIVGGFVGQQISINASFRNFQETAQAYAIIIQVVDENGFTTDIGWTQGSLERGASADASRSWTIEETGNYTIKIFVWDGVSAGPVPLSETTEKNFSVN